jgi:hypothetical protein
MEVEGRVLNRTMLWLMTTVFALAFLLAVEALW